MSGKRTSISESILAAKTQQMLNRMRRAYQLGQQANSESESLRLVDFRKKYAVGEHTLRKYRAFARQYNSSEFEVLCSLRRPNGLPLHWGYLPYLLTVSDHKLRSTLQREAAAKGWTPHELYAEIRQRFRNPRRDRPGGLGGRPLKTEHSLSLLVQEVERLARQILAANNAAHAQPGLHDELQNIAKSPQWRDMQRTIHQMLAIPRKLSKRKKIRASYTSMTPA